MKFLCKNSSMPDLCFICGNDSTEEGLAKVTEKGKDALEKMIKDSSDKTLLLRFQTQWAENPTCLKYHKNCKRDMYNTSKNKSRKRKLDESFEQESKKKKQRSHTELVGKVFLPYKNKCILCNDLVCLFSNCDRDKKRMMYTQPDNFTASNLKGRIEKTADERLSKDPQDKWAMEVKGRLVGINDLVAEESLLHKRCNTRFLQGRSFIAEGDKGRKIEEDRISLLDELCSWLDSEMEHNLFTLDDIHKKMISLDTTADKSLVYGRQYLKRKLLEKYKDEIYFTSQPRRADILCFKDSTANIIRDYHSQSGEDEKTKIIKTAVKLIQNDIALVNMDPSNYPSINKMTDYDSQLKIIPESLKLFLKPLVKSDKRVAVWGESLIKTSRPRSGVLPLTMRFSLQLDHRFGSRWLIDELHSYGLCEPYEELRNYKYCYLRNSLKSKMNLSTLYSIQEDEGEDEDDCVNCELQLAGDGDKNCSNQAEELLTTQIPEATDYNNVQFVGDNIDLNIVSINGNTPFHAMGLIKIVPEVEGITSEYLKLDVPRIRLTPKEKAEALRAGEIDIISCRDPQKSGINSVQFLPMTNLSELFSSTPPITHPEDLLWAAGWVVKKIDKNFSHANWNGWMKSIHRANHEKVSHIEYQPIIDGDPNDISTIYTTLLRCIELETPNVTVVTFDLPIWLKAVDLILSKGLPIIPRLGGFHLLKSFLGTFGSIFADSGLHDIIQLFYRGSLVADSILNGNSFEKAIRTHFLIDAAIIQHVLTPDIFDENELIEIRELIEKVKVNHQQIELSDYPIASVFQSKLEDKFKRLENGGRTSALWALYHYMVDTIKIFIRAERLGDFSLHLSCITNRMLHVFAAAGHHHYAKAARLYVQLMSSYEQGSTSQSAVIKSFKSTGSHVIRYSSHEWSGIWSDLCIEQTLMKTSKSNGGLSGGRFRSGESAHKIWVQTLSHLSLINRLSSSDKSNKNLHRDLAISQRIADEKAILLISQWLDDMLPFDHVRDRDILISFSTGFFSKGNDGINPENAIDIGKQIQSKMNWKVPSAKIEAKSKVQPLSNLRRNVGGQGQADIQVNALKYFNRLVIFSQRESNLEKSLEYELTPIPLSLFSQKDQLMYESNKAVFAQTCLKDHSNRVNMQHRKIGSLIIDGGWLLRQSNWEQSDSWGVIVAGYVNYVKLLGKQAESIFVIFDGYEKSTKDHTHRRRQKYFCHDMKIRLDNLPYTTKEKFLSNGKNKTELISSISDALADAGIGVICCRDDADTSIVRSAITHASQGTVEVRAEDADILIMLLHHYETHLQPIILTTMKGSYDIDDISKNLSDKQKRYLLFCHSFTGCDTVSSIYGFSKEKLFERLITGDLNTQIDVFYNESSTRDDIQRAGIEIFQYIYGSPKTSLSKQRLHQYQKQSKMGVIRPESLPPTGSAAAQHSLRAYLQLQDWLVLRSMSRDPNQYGWFLSVNGYEPVFTTEPMAPENLLRFISCNCKGNCSSQRCSCKKNNVKCIPTCGNCHGSSCKNVNSEISSIEQ